MKKTILIILILISNIDIQAQSFGANSISNNSFSLTHTNGDFKLRRYSSGDLIWKRALVPESTTLYLNYGGDFSNGMRIMGSKLHVDGNIITESEITVRNPSNISANVTLNWYNDIARLRIGGEGDGASNGFEIQGISNKTLLKLKQTGDMLVDGNVGIGTVNPDSKLTVAGKIHCEEVQVDLDVAPDYVFEKYYTGVSDLKEDYTMPTLEEIEAYTKENHHLPSVPSATEIKEEGLQLKEMTSLLLQKIEELTLYTIEQEKRIKALESQITTQK